jgi:hypothetical protein
MSTNSWTPAPAGYPESAGLAVSSVGVPMHTAAPFGIRITSIVPRFNGTPLGIRSSRRPSS